VAPFVVSPRLRATAQLGKAVNADANLKEFWLGSGASFDK
jgi:hypothetical protein